MATVAVRLTAAAALLGTACNSSGIDGPKGTGSILWRVPVTENGNGWTGLPAILGATAYVETSNTVLALDAATGARRWQTVIKTALSPGAANIAALGTGVYIADGADVVALDATSGAVRWRYTTDDLPEAAQTAVDDYAVYTGTRSHRVYALDPATGTPRWTTDVGAGWPYLGVVAGLATSGDTVYASVYRRLTVNGDSSVGVIAGLDRHTGAILFEYTAQQSTAQSTISSAPVIAGALLLASDLGGAFFAIDRFTLQQVWRVQTGAGFFGPYARPAVSGDRVYIGSNDGTVYAVTLATGQLVWQVKTDASIHESAVCGETVFANNQGVVALARSSGSVLRVLFDDANSDEVVSSGFGVAGDRVIVSALHNVYALRC